MGKICPTTGLTCIACVPGAPCAREDNILDFEANMPHSVSEVMCWKCGKRWIAVYQSDTLLKELECPQCHNQGFAFLTGQELKEDA